MSIPDNDSLLAEVSAAKTPFERLRRIVRLVRDNEFRKTQSAPTAIWVGALAAVVGIFLTPPHWTRIGFILPVAGLCAFLLIATIKKRKVLPRAFLFFPVIVAVVVTRARPSPNGFVFWGESLQLYGISLVVAYGVLALYLRSRDSKKIG